MLRHGGHVTSIGTDICAISRIRRLLEGPHSRRFLRKVLLPEERAQNKDRCDDLIARWQELEKRKALLAWSQENLPIAADENDSKDGMLSDEQVRCYEKQEIEKAEEEANKGMEKAAMFMAGRWAAKEAIIKALNRKVFFQNVRIDKPTYGNKPKALVLTAKSCKKPILGSEDWEKAEEIQVSISHDLDYAIATCISTPPAPSTRIHSSPAAPEASDRRSQVPVRYYNPKASRSSFESTMEISNDGGEEEYTYTSEQDSLAPKEQLDGRTPPTALVNSSAIDQDNRFTIRRFASYGLEHARRRVLNGMLKGERLERERRNSQATWRYPTYDARHEQTSFETIESENKVSGLEAKVSRLEARVSELEAKLSSNTIGSTVPDSKATGRNIEGNHSVDIKAIISSVGVCDDIDFAEIEAAFLLAKTSYMRTLRSVEILASMIRHAKSLPKRQLAYAEKLFSDVLKTEQLVNDRTMAMSSYVSTRSDESLRGFQKSAIHKAREKFGSDSAE